jgi:hypothetical protein
MTNATEGTTDGREQMSPTQQQTGSTSATGASPMRERVADATHRFVDETQQRVREGVRSRLDSGKRRTSGTLNAIASSLRQGNVEDEETARFMQKAGDQVEKLSQYLDTTDVQQIARQAEDLARRQPAVFLGTAFVLGLAAARFFKAGRQRSGAGSEARLGSTQNLGGEPLESQPGFRPMPDDPAIGRQGPIGGFPGPSGYTGQL